MQMSTTNAVSGFVTPQNCENLYISAPTHNPFAQYRHIYSISCLLVYSNVLRITSIIPRTPKLILHSEAEKFDFHNLSFVMT